MVGWDVRRPTLMGLGVLLALGALMSCQCHEVLSANAETHRALLALRQELGVDCTLRWHSDTKMSPDVFEVQAWCRSSGDAGHGEDLEPRIRAVLEPSFHRRMSRCSIVIGDSSAPG
jgi:hypothetical protein